MPTRQNKKLKDFIHVETRQKIHSMPDWNSDWTGGFKAISRSTKKQHLLFRIADSWLYWQVQRDLLRAWHRGRGASLLKDTLNTIYSRDLAYLSWKLQGVEGWDGDRLQIKRSQFLRFFTKIRFSIRIPSCSLRPSGCPLLTRWFTQTRGLQTMVFSCSVCECQANTQPKVVVLEVRNWIIAVITSLRMMPCTGRREWELVNYALHWGEGTEPLFIFLLSRQMNSQKRRDKGFNSEKTGSIFCLTQGVPATVTVPCWRGKSWTFPWGLQDLSGSEPFCARHCADYNSIHKTSPYPETLVGCLRCCH